MAINGCKLAERQTAVLQRGLTVPSIRLDLSAIDQALEQHVPVVTVPEHPSAGEMHSKSAKPQYGALGQQQLITAQGASAVLCCGTAT